MRVASPRAVPPLKRARRYLRAKLLLALTACAALLPLKLSLWLGAALGEAAFGLARRQRRLALAHLAVAFPDLSERERVAIARACFENLGRTVLELAQARRIDPLIARYVRWSAADIDVMRGALKEGKGGLFITAHLGNWELLARRIVAEGFDHLAITRTPGDPGLAEMLERLRGAGGVRTVDRSAFSARREILTALKRGSLVGILLDQDTRVQGLFVPFFGRPAHTPRAAEDLARRMGMPVFFGTIKRLPEGGHELRTELFSPAGADATGLTARLTARIEAEIRLRPSEWVWMHERWRQRPSQD